MSVDFASKDRTAFDLSGKVIVIVGGGQMPGDKIGNGRATAVLAARQYVKSRRKRSQLLTNRTVVNCTNGRTATNC